MPNEVVSIERRRHALAITIAEQLEDFDRDDLIDTIESDKPLIPLSDPELKEDEINNWICDPSSLGEPGKPYIYYFYEDDTKTKKLEFESVELAYQYLMEHYEVLEAHLFSN